MGSTGGGTYGSNRRGITIRKDVQLDVDSMPCSGSHMTQIPLLPTVRDEGWEQHVAVKSHLGKAEFKQQSPWYSTWSPFCSDFMANIYCELFMQLSLPPTVYMHQKHFYLTFIIRHLIYFSCPWYGVYIRQPFKSLHVVAYKRL